MLSIDTTTSSSRSHQSSSLSHTILHHLKNLRFWKSSSNRDDEEETRRQQQLAGGELPADRKRMRCNDGGGDDDGRNQQHSIDTPTPQRRRLERSSTDGVAAEEGGMTIARQAPAAQQQRRHHSRQWYESKLDDPMSPLPSLPFRQQQGDGAWGGGGDQHPQRQPSVAEVVRAQASRATAGNPWAQPIVAKFKQAHRGATGRLSGSVVGVVSGQPSSTTTLVIGGEPVGGASSRTSMHGSGGLSLQHTNAATALTTTRSLFSGRNAQHTSRSSGSLISKQTAVGHSGVMLLPPRPPTSTAANVEENTGGRWQGEALYVEEDLLAAATLAARVRDAQTVLFDASTDAQMIQRIRRDVAEMEVEDNRLRALYNLILLDVVEEETKSVVHGLVGRTEGAIEAFLRSLVVPVVTQLLPTPRGVLKHIRSGTTVFLPLELDTADLTEIDRLCPLPPAPPPLTEQLFGASSPSVSSSAGSWMGSAVSGAAKMIASTVGHFMTGPPPSQQYTSQIPSSRQPGDNDFVIDDEGYQIRRYQLASLRGVTWVNDQVINYYFHIIQRLFPDVTSLGSHLYAKLAAGDIAGALRWVRRRDIFSSRVVLIAVNLNNSHWTLAVVNMEQKRLYYFDSLQGESYGLVLQRVAAFMDEAYAARHNGELPAVRFTTWPRSTDEGLRAKYYDTLPRQANNNDCGVFVTQFGLCAACGITPDFTQGDITLLRNVLLLELSQKQMLRRIHR